MEVRNIPMQTRLASFEPAKVDPEARTAEIVWTTGAAVQRGGWFTDPYMEELSVDPKAIRMGRLNGGAPFLNSHDSMSLDSVIGVVERAWVQDGEGRAVVRFSDRADVQPIFNDVKNGIIRNISVGYRVHKMEDVTDKGAKMRTFRAVDWEPYELSAVAIPADAGAGFRGSAASTNPCEIEFRSATADGGPSNEEPPMDMNAKAVEPTVTDETRAAPAAPSLDEAAIRAKAIADERTRVAELHTVAAKLGLGADFVKRHTDAGTPVDVAYRDAIDERAAKDTISNPVIEIVKDHTDPAEVRSAMANALASRLAPSLVQVEGRGVEFRSHSLADMAGELMIARGLKGVNLRNRTQIVDALFSRDVGPHTTSDFPLLLQDALNKTLLAGHNVADPSYRKWAQKRTFNDFRAHKFDRIGDFPTPVEVSEGGATNYGTISENREQITPKEYNAGVAISRRALINDDMGAFSDFAGLIGRRVADFENVTVYGIIANDGPTLSDSVAMYHTSSHGANKAGTGTVINPTNIGAGWSVMMSQTGLDGIKLNIPPKFLVVGTAKYVEAAQQITQITPNQTTQVNPFVSMLTIVPDANVSGTRWHLFADPAQAPVVVYGYVNDAGPMITTETEFDTKAVKVRVGMDFAAGAIDYRGTYLNTGA